MDDVASHITTGAMLVYGLEYLKRSGWCSFLTADTGVLNRVVSGLAALVMALGISLTGDSSAGWTATIPPASVLLSGAFEALKQFTTQQLLYDSMLAPRALAGGDQWVIPASPKNVANSSLGHSELASKV